MPKQGRVQPGVQFGKLTAVERIGSDRVSSYWRLRCKCGNIVVRRASQLKFTRQHNCGCYESERRKGIPFAQTHGLSKTKLYQVWEGMKQRCYNPKNAAFKNYGGRGIAICDEWRRDFAAFAKWAEANGYSPGIDIDRENNDLGYSPGNCRFVTRAVNMANRRCSRKVR